MALTSTVTALADSLFLANYPVTSLPAYLIALHFVGVIISMAFFLSNQKQQKPRELFFLHSVMALLALNAVSWAGGISWLSQSVLCVVVHASATTINVATWAQTMGHVHTASAKSQAPLLAAGLTIGGTFSGILLILVGRFVLVETAILYAIILLILFSPLVFILDRALFNQNKTTKKSFKASPPAQKQTKEVKKAFDDPLVQFLGLVSFIFAIGSTFLDFQYKSILQSQPNAESIAYYLGGLHLVLNILVLTGQLTLSQLMVQQIRVHRIFVFYPRFVLLAVASAIFMPALLGAFFARITERTFRYLVLNASTDIFMGPMRDHFKTRAVWLTKGIAGPLGTLVSLLFILVFFQIFTPGSEAQVSMLYAATFVAFSFSLLFARKLEKKYQAFLGESLGMNLLGGVKENSQTLASTPKAGPTIGSVPRKGDDIGLVELEFLNTDMAVTQRRRVLFKLGGALNEAGAQIFLDYLKGEKDVSVLLIAQRFLIKQKRKFQMPTTVQENAHPLIKHLANHLSSNKAPIAPLKIPNDFSKLCMHLETEEIENFQKKKYLHHLRQERDVFEKYEFMIDQLMLGTPWFHREGDLSYPKWRHLVHLYNFINTNPLGILTTELLPNDALTEFVIQQLNSSKKHRKIWAMQVFAFRLAKPQVLNVSYDWAKNLCKEDVQYLVPILEHPNPFFRTRALALLYLCKHLFSDLKFDDKVLGEAIQRTTLDCMIGTGIRAEDQQYRVMRTTPSTEEKRDEGFALLLDAQHNELVTLFFGMYGLIVGPIWAKQLYKKFAHGSHLTQADVVEYCRTQAESKLIEPMMMVLGTLHPERKLQLLRQNLPRVKTSFLKYAKRHSRLPWFKDWIKLSRKERNMLGQKIETISFGDYLRKLPPDIILDLAINAQSIHRHQPNNSLDPVPSLMMSQDGEFCFVNKQNEQEYPPNFKSPSSIYWSSKTLERIKSEDYVFHLALLKLKKRSH